MVPDKSSIISSYLARKKDLTREERAILRLPLSLCPLLVKQCLVTGNKVQTLLSYNAQSQPLQARVYSCESEHLRNENAIGLKFSQDRVWCTIFIHLFSELAGNHNKLSDTGRFEGNCSVYACYKIITDHLVQLP